MYKLSDIFKTNNRQAQRKILDKFDISKEDKNKTLNELADSNKGGSVSKYAPRYFKIDWDKASKDWEYILTLGNVDTTVQQSNVVLSIAASYKTIVKKSNYSRITGYPFITTSDAIGFSYIPLFISKTFIDNLQIEAKTGFQTFEDMVILLSKVIPQLLGVEVNLSMEGITEITEDEYYKID